MWVLASDKMAKKLKQHKLAQLFLPFFAGWSVIIRTQNKCFCFDVLSNEKALFIAKIRNNMNHTMCMGLTNCARKLVLSWVPFLEGHSCLWKENRHIKLTLHWFFAGTLADHAKGICQKVAIKVPKVSCLQQQRQELIDFYREAQISIAIKHKNVLCCLGIIG